MNLLTQTPPTKIKINNKIYNINYDFRTIINILLAFEDKDLTYEEQVYIMLKNLYEKEIPEEDFEEAVRLAIKFIDLGEEQKENKPFERIYSYKKDGNYIMTGINSTHNIDIEKNPDLHWWKFMALFMDMSSECMFGELVYYRKRKLEGKLTPDEQKQYKKIKDLVDLEEVKSQSKERKKFFEQYHKKKNKEVLILAGY